MQSLSGKVVVITGASAGIGAASARLLAEAGCSLVLAARSSDRLRSVAASLAAPTLTVVTDVSRRVDIQELVAASIEHFGRIDVLVANAGLYTSGSILDCEPDRWEALIDTNVNGVVRSVQEVLPHMVSNGSGDVIITSSVSGLVEAWSEPIYGASKHAIQTFAHSIRRQVANLGIRVGVVAPGKVANELWGVTDQAEVERLVDAHEGLNSEDVASAVVFMLTRPEHVTIRDLVIVPKNQNV